MLLRILFSIVSVDQGRFIVLHVMVKALPGMWCISIGPSDCLLLSWDETRAKFVFLTPKVPYCVPLGCLNEGPKTFLVWTMSVYCMADLTVRVSHRKA